MNMNEFWGEQRRIEDDNYGAELRKRKKWNIIA
jgi:hypothetical protein